MTDCPQYSTSSILEWSDNMVSILDMCNFCTGLLLNNNGPHVSHV